MPDEPQTRDGLMNLRREATERNAPGHEEAPGTWRLVGALAAVYVIWGSTYLAIRFAVETLPPFLMAGVRFAVAGAILYAISRAGGAQRPTLRQWRAAAIVGALMLLGGNGGVVWAVQFVPSGLTALLIAITPLWMVLLDWAMRGPRPTALVLAGIGLAVGGVAVLTFRPGYAGPDAVSPIGAIVILAATVAWAIGSLYSRRADLPASQRLTTALTMLAGGAWLIAAGLAGGELARLTDAQVSMRSTLALLYLILFGSLIAFTAYLWLLRATTPARATTYAFVNPIVAVLLGWLLAEEALSSTVVISTALIVAGVVLITQFGPGRQANHGSD